MSDPLRLNLSWLTQADNVDVTDTGQLLRCKGYTQSTSNTSVTGAYATNDLQRLYVVDNGELRAYDEGLSYTVLRTGLSATPMDFEEVSGIVFYTNGTDYGMIEPGGHRAWGIPNPTAPLVQTGAGNLPEGTYQVLCTYTDDRGMESGNGPVTAVYVSAGRGLVLTNIPSTAGYTTNVYVTDANGTVFYLVAENAGASLTLNAPLPLGRELPFWNVSPPRGEQPTLFQGSLYLSEPFPAYNHTVIWRTLPLHFHHLDLSGEGIAVPGTVRMLGAANDVLVLGTDRQTWAWTGAELKLLADYGVTTGWHATKAGDQLLWWSLRGLCTAMPFRNLTEDTVSVPPGASAGATVIEQDGYRRYLVSLVQDDTPAYNTRAAMY